MGAGAAAAVDGVGLDAHCEFLVLVLVSAVGGGWLAGLGGSEIGLAWLVL